jgi:queuine tRNA-ribosyltransferase
LKHIDFPTADACGCELIFCNTAHFLVNTGPNIVQEAGGLHSFISRPMKPLITDSSGFQVFSWGEKLVTKVDTNKGITFKSYRDGHDIQVTPESSIQAQALLGADIILVLDELIGFDNATCMYSQQLRKTLELTSPMTQ